MNGQPATSEFVRTQSAYVPQFDNFIPTMTVREVLQFYARTILPTNYSRQAREHKIESVMEMMGIYNQADVLVRDWRGYNIIQRLFVVYVGATATCEHKLLRFS